MNKEKYLDRFKIHKQSKEQALASQIYEGFKRKVPYTRIFMIIMGIGHQAAYEAWNECGHAGIKNPLSLFLWKTNEIKKQIKWNK